MKETTPNLTETKKKEAEKWIKTIYENTGIKFKCKSMKDYAFLKMLYLVLINYIEEENDFLYDIEHYYIDKENLDYVLNQKYFGYDVNDMLSEYLVKYMYGDLINFSVTWNYYDNIPKEDFDKKLNQSYRVLNKKLDKNASKMNHLLDNISVLMMDYNTFKIYDTLVEENPDSEIYLIWKATRDNVTCETCSELNGRKFLRIREVPMRHPNCRCEILIMKDGEIFTKIK